MPKAAAAEAINVLAFWLGEVPPEKRFARDDALDAAIRTRFGALHARLADEVPETWRQTPERILATIIVLDQFSRNIYRNSPKAWAWDPVALSLTREALSRSFDEQLQGDQLQFLFMPLMHSESATDQALSVALFESLDNPVALDFARQHKAIIDRFGRFPHRNAVLGRESTPEEIEFLKQPRSSF